MSAIHFFFLHGNGHRSINDDAAAPPLFSSSDDDLLTHDQS
jgi:hypothetical protein